MTCSVISVLCIRPRLIYREGEQDVPPGRTQVHLTQVPCSLSLSPNPLPSLPSFSSEIFLFFGARISFFAPSLFDSRRKKSLALCSLLSSYSFV